MNRFCLSILSILLLATLGKAQHVPSPKEHFGFNIGVDYMLANFTQTEAYFKKLAASPRTKYVDIGLTEEGRHQFMLIVSSPGNIRHLEKYKTISQRLTRAEGLSEAEAHKLASEGKAIVWIDGGLHASETVGTQQLIEIAYDMVNGDSPEVKQILDKTIILFVHANPDGQELVSNWYMQEKDPKKRNMNVPRLWQKYIGHDNNRDFFMMNMKETQNMTHQQFLEWFPQIVYNHHQAGPPGTVVAGPPYRDPYNYVYDPLLITSLDEVGAAMVSRLNQEGKPGYTERNGTPYSTWWNGGLRTTTYFHNMIGLLTEIVGNPTPTEIPLVPERLLPSGNTPFPVAPQPWHFRQSIDYDVSLNFAVLDYATRNSDALLYNAYRMGKNSIERGSADYWTRSPKKIDMINAAYYGISTSAVITPRSGSSTMSNVMPVKYYDTVFKNPVLRDARGYIIRANQPDFPTALRFVNALINSGIIVQKATADFTVAGKQYPKGSYIVKTDQAFRPHVLDMFEPQDHPNDFLYPGGPPIKPYDITGWTLAYQMGVEFDRIPNGFTGPFDRIPYGKVQTAPVQKVPATSRCGYLLSPNENNSFIAVNNLLNSGAEVYRLTEASDIPDFGPGAFYISATTSPTVKAALVKAGADWGVRIINAPKRPRKLVKLSTARVALWDTYGGSIPSGWIRWLMEQYHFPYHVIYPQEIDTGNLKSKYDVIVFVGGAIPPVNDRRLNADQGNVYGRTPNPEELPEEYRSWTGRITAEKSIPQLKAFLLAGGNIVTIGSSANLAYQLKLPVHDALVEKTKAGDELPLSSDKFYVPGSILRVTFNTALPANWGMFKEGDVDFDNDPAFKMDADAPQKGIRPLAWFATDKPLRSGWAWGQQYLKDAIAAFEAQVGQGKLYVFGPEITFRGQAHGTFKLLFNELYVKK